MRSANHRLVTNTEGSNLERGIAAALLKDSASADVGLFEVDEAALGAIAGATRPSVIVLMNLFRDQLDRYGELETLVSKWADVLDQVGRQTSPPTLVMNADDPNIAALGDGRDNVVWFGVNDTNHALDSRAHAADATTCRQCQSPIAHSVVLLGHLGHWACTNCDATRPSPMISASQINLSGDSQSVVVDFPDGNVTIESALPGLHNSYNMVAAFAASWALAQRTGAGHDAQASALAIGETQAAFGRGEMVSIGDKQLQLLLAKNPTGVNQNVRTIMTAPQDLHVLVLLNDRTADGKDISWIWDVDWEPLQPRLASLTLGGDRAWDLALRFRYGGFDMDTVTIEPDPAAALDAALAATPDGNTLHALPTYTAMLDLRSVLTERGHTSAYWSDDE